MADLNSINCLGIIAGHGDLPRDIIQACQRQNIPYYIMAYDGQTDPKFVQGLPHDWVGLGQAGKTIKHFETNKVDHIVMAGYFNRPAWSELKPDFKGVALMAKLVGKPMGDDGLFRVIVDFFENEGLIVISPEDLLGPKALVSLKDIKRGLSVAKALGAQDVGQSVVVQQGLILGVEALEGSDELIKRTASLKQEGPGGVFVKVIKPNQETRVDRAVIGPRTVEYAAEAGLRGIAAEADHVILLNKDETIALADAKGLFITGVSHD